MPRGALQHSRPHWRQPGTGNHSPPGRGCVQHSGIKESSGNLQQITELIHLLPENCAVLAGDDLMALPVIALGGAGLISVASNEIPGEMTRMVDAAVEGDWATARILYRRFFRLVTANFWESSPGPVKCVMAMMGLLEENYRLPIVPVTSATREKLAALVEELGLSFRWGAENSWGPRPLSSQEIRRDLRVSPSVLISRPT